MNLFQKKTRIFTLLSLFFNLTSVWGEFYSQCGQDRFLYENFFHDKRNGVFVDIGAHDGIFFNNTYFFEKHLDWTGICIEPIPEVFESLKNSRTSLCIQGCIYSKADTVSFLRVFGNPPDLEMLSGILENYDSKHIERIESEILRLGGRSEVLTVKCYDLTKLLIDNNIRHVDYLSIDTEGGELDILKSIDFSKIRIDVIDVENNYQSPAFKEFLESVGYIFDTR